MDDSVRQIHRLSSERSFVKKKTYARLEHVCLVQDYVVHEKL